MIRSMRTALRRLALGCLVTTLLAVAGPSRAGTLVLEFDLSTSTSAVIISPGVLSGPRDAAGSLKLTLTGVNSDGSLQQGASEAFLSDLSLTVSSIATAAMVPDFSAISTDALTQTGTARGVFDGMRIVFDAGQIVGQHDASDVCQGALCALLFTVERPDGPFSNMVPFAIELASVAEGAMLRGVSTFPFVLGAPQIGQTALRLRGTETRRSSVPEPGQVGLLALAGLAAAALRRSRRAAQPGVEHA